MLCIHLSWWTQFHPYGKSMYDSFINKSRNFKIVSRQNRRLLTYKLFHAPERSNRLLNNQTVANGTEPNSTDFPKSSYFVPLNAFVCMCFFSYLSFSHTLPFSCCFFRYYLVQKAFDSCIILPII